MRAEHITVDEASCEDMQMDTAKALVQGLGFRDYTHWRRLEDTGAGPVFELELGSGTSIRSVPSVEIPDDRTDVTLTCIGKGFSLSISANRADVRHGSVEIECCGNSARIELSRGYDWRAYSERFHAKALKRDAAGIRFDRFDGPRPTDIVIRSGGYRGTVSPGPKAVFDRGFLGTLTDAVSRERFGGLLPSYSMFEGPVVGPFDFTINGMEDAIHCSDIRASIRGHIGDLLRFSIDGVLTSDDRGIVFKGERSEFVIEADTSVPMDIDRRYLGSHPVPTWSFDDDDRW